MNRTSWVIIADGDENIPGSTQPSLGQNESTMERHVISPLNQPSRQRSDNSTVPQTNSQSNIHAPSVNSGQAANMENPAMQAMNPEGNGNIIMQGSKDYLEMIQKQASDSAIYFRGFADGRQNREMDKSLSNLSDDYFNGWQDGQIYKHLPIEDVEHNLVDMKPGSNADGSFGRHDALPDDSLKGWGNIGGSEFDYVGHHDYAPHDPREAHANSGLGSSPFDTQAEFTPRQRAILEDLILPTESKCGFAGRGCGTSLQVAMINKRKAERGQEELCPNCYRVRRTDLHSAVRNASVDKECNECGSVRIAHCGTCEGSSEDLKETTEKQEEPKEKTASFHCKNCNNSGVVCRDCGCPRFASADDSDNGVEDITSDGSDEDEE